MNRKDFFKTSAVALAGLAIAPAFIESCKKASTTPQGPTVNFTIDLTASANAALNNIGGFVYSNGVIVARVNSNTLGFVALAQACTHQGCTIAYNAGSSNFYCPCHGGTYDLNGSVTGGPPPSAVTKYTITRSNNILTIKN
ncbi:MAG: Rieske (2Fe-2S) protein [Bacteroidota bacterium]